jgi:two-component system chemotaxis response regulator CheB
MKSKTAAPARSNPAIPFGLVAVAASAGGLKALSQVLSALPGDFPAALVVVVHISPHHKSHLADILARRTTLRVKHAAEGDRLHPGTVFIALPDRHLVVNPDGTLSLCHSGRVRHVRPSGDVLFASLAISCQDRAIAVVLTGGDDDGATGARLVQAMGGTVIAQDEASAEHPAMPRAAIATGAVDHVLPLGQIAPLLEHLTKPGAARARQKPDAPPTGRKHSSCGEPGSDGHYSPGGGRAAVPAAMRRRTSAPARRR